MMHHRAARQTNLHFTHTAELQSNYSKLKLTVEEVGKGTSKSEA